jgi:hypothetical protein
MTPSEAKDPQEHFWGWSRIENVHRVKAQDGIQDIAVRMMKLRIHKKKKNFAKERTDVFGREINIKLKMIEQSHGQSSINVFRSW